MYYIDDINIGKEINKSIEITEKLHFDFCKLSGDDSPIHTNKEFAKKSNYEEPIGYAFLIPTLLSGIYGKIFPAGSELCLSQNCEFRAVYYVGDTLFFNLKVIQKNTSFKLITLDVNVKNQNNIKIFSGQSIMKLILGDNEFI